MSLIVNMRSFIVIFGERVKEIRLARGLTQQDLADQARLNRSYIGEIEIGRRNVTLLTMSRLATALNVPLHTLLIASKHDSNNDKG